jgi:hypothetical protein
MTESNHYAKCFSYILLIQLLHDVTIFPPFLVQETEA